LPLASDDRDTVLDLHTAFTRCYDQGGFASKIDYQHEPGHELIARVAYSRWQKEGCLHGHDRDHWFRAVGMLRVP
jgi:hypothetical protein